MRKVDQLSQKSPENINKYGNTDYLKLIGVRFFIARKVHLVDKIIKMRRKHHIQKQSFQKYVRPAKGFAILHKGERTSRVHQTQQANKEKRLKREYQTRKIP